MDRLRFRPSLDTLEDRTVPAVSVTLTDGVLQITGSEHGDYLFVFPTSGQADRITVTGMELGKFVYSGEFKTADVTSIEIDGRGGRDLVANVTGITSILKGGAGDDVI